MKRFNFSPRVNPDSGPTVSRRSALTLRYLCATLVLLFSLGIGQMWAAEGDVVYTLNTAASSIPIATSNSYGNYADATNNWKVTCGSKQTAGLWLGSNSTQKAKMILNTGSFPEASGIASAISVQTSSTYYAAIIGTSELENVGKVTLTYTTPGGTAPSEAWICYSTNSGSTWSIAKKVTTLSTSGTDFVFDETIESARYAFVIHCTAYCQFKVPVLTFYEGATAAPSTPYVSVDPDALSFGTVEQNASVAAKTFSVTGSNLTGAITITSPNAGFTVTPASITPTDGAIAATDVTVTPVTTAANTFDGNVVISGGGLENNVTVALTMTVAAPVAVTGVSLNKEATSLEIGATETLTATIAPEEATNKNVTWESSDGAVATVDANGVVTAVAAGNATITCKSAADNTISATCAVTVVAAVEYSKVTSAPGDWSGEYLLVYEDGTSAYVYTGVDEASNYVSATISNNKITKPSGAAKLIIAEMTGDDAGKYSLKVVGGTNDGKYLSGTNGSNTTNFGADAAPNTLGYSTDHVTITSNTSNLTFNSASNNLRFRYFKSTSTQSAVQLYKKAAPTHEFTFAVKSGDESKGSVTASVGGSAITSVAQVEEGATVTLTPSANQYYQVKAVTILDGYADEVTVTNNDGVYSFTMPSSDVEAEVSFEYIPVTSVSVDATLELVEGETHTLSATVLPVTALGTVNWASDNTDVATVDANGEVTAVSAGTANITATSAVTGSVSGTCAVTVTAPTGNPITISQTTGGTVAANVDVADVLEGVSVTLTATPTAGYSVSGWTIVGVDAGDLTISIDKATCSFAMPDGEVLAEASFTHETATLKLVELGVENTYDSENTHYWKESVTLPGLSGLGCSDKVFRGWSADANCTTEPTLKAGDSYEIPNKGENKLYAVFATASEGSTSWDEITAVPTVAGEYAICTENYFMKASIASNRFENGDATPSITDGVLDEAPASDCIWELSINGDGKFLFKNGTKYAAGNGTKNQGALNTDATDTKSQWTITYNNGFVITNVYNSSESVNAVLRQNGTYGWAAYGATQNGAAGAPRLFKKTIGEASYSGYTTTCTAQLPVLAAPTFPVAEGVFYESTDITISAATGASIYYTTDGTTPSSTKGTLYEGVITLNAYGTYNFKAIAVQAGHEDSEVAEATYYFGMTFASVSDLYTYLEANSLTELNNVKVTGLVSRITTAWDAQKGYLTYYISDNGQTTNDLQMYHGAGEGASALAEGDQVTVTGNYTLYQSTTREFAAGSIIVARTAAAVASVAIGGAAEKTTYSPEDNQFSYTGLTATATYNTGYTKDVTALATWTNNLENNTVVASANVEVTATYEGESDTKDVTVTYTTKTLDHITLSYTNTTAYVGMALPTPTVTASYVEDIEDEDVTALVTKAQGFDTESAYNNTVAGSYTINVSYTLGEVTKSAEYTVTVKSVFGNEENPHNVADATAMIIASAYQSITSSTDYMWVRGKVVGFNGTSNNNYYISDDGTSTGQLYVFGGKYFNGATMNATNKPAVGDEVILKATILNYQGNTPELTGSQVVSQLREPEFAIADIIAGDEFEAGFSADMTVVPTVNSGDVEFTLASNNEAVVTIVEGKLHAVEEGDAVITASRAATANENALNYKAKEITFNVHVIAERTRYTVTFDANGGEGTDPEDIANQLAGATVDMPTSTPLYNKEGHAFTGWKVINLNTEAEIEVVNDQFEMPESNVKIQAQWAVVATCAISFQIGGHEVATANAPQEADYNIPANTTHPTVDGFTFLGWSETEYADEVETAPTLINVYHAQAGEESKVLYGIYSRVEGAGETNHYVLDYSQESALSSSTSWGAYGTAFDYTAADGSAWVVKAYKNAGMQMNTGKNASIKIPECPGNIVSIGITCSAAKAVGLSAADYTGSGTITYIVYGTDATSQTLDFAGKTVTGGYIVPKTGSTAITRIDVAYSAEVTYYTSSPVEKVTVTFALDGGEGGCQTTKINKGGQLTICADVPTKSHSEFAGWKNGDDVYVAGTAYTFDADITLTAQWNEAAKYTVTYAAGGAEGTVPADANEYYAGEQVTVLGQGGLEKSGYDFQGWRNGNKLYAADATFAMPDENVTLTAQWRIADTTKAKVTQTLLTDANMLIDGNKVVIGCNGTYQYLAGQLSSTNSKYLIAENSDITFSDNAVSYTNNNVIEWTMGKSGNGWTLKNGDNYLGENGENLTIDSNNATVWNISISANGEATMESNSYTLRFNPNLQSGVPSTPRFKTYSSSSNMKLVQLYGKALVVNADANISDLGYVAEEALVASGKNVTLTIDVPTTTPSITAKDGATVVIDAPTTTQSVNVEEGSKIEAQEATTTPTVNFAITLGADGTPSTGSALGKVNNITLAAGGEIHYDITLGVNMTTDSGRVKAANQWHAFTVPFPVNVTNGIYNAETGAKLTNNVDYAIMDYHGDIRANGEYGWKRFGGTLVPGVFYIMTINGDVSTFRFKMSVAANTALQALNSMAYTAYSGSGESSDHGWNGIGNPSWVSVKLPYDVQVLDPKSYTYQPLTAGTVISASTPFFYKAGSSSTMMMTESSDSVQYAPRRMPANELKKMTVSFGNEVFADKIYVSASEDALNEYEQDKDLVRMIMNKAPKVAQIFAEAYGMKLCMVNAPMTNNNAEVALDLYTPAAGEYTISVPAIEGYNVYLVREGAIIWNLTTSEYTADFDKGNNAGYSIRIVRAPMMPTDLVDNIYDGAEGVQKVVIDDHVYILRNEKMYDVTGKMVK